MTPEDLITLTSARTLQRMDVPGTGKPYWTVREAGMACFKLEPEIFAALLYSYAGADECYHQLWTPLRQFAERLRWREKWPMQVHRNDGTRADYLDELVSLCLIEERQPWRFGSVNGWATSPMYLAVLRVTGKCWRARLAAPYADLRWRYITWLSIGRKHMKDRMKAREPYPYVTETLANTNLVA